jgi:hypothetical protein
MMDAIDPWLRAFGGVVLLCTGALLPLARRLLVRDDWTAILRRPRLVRLAQAQEVLGQAALGAFGSASLISATPALFAFDPAAALLGTLLGAGIGIMASLAQIVLIIIVRRAP